MKIERPHDWHLNIDQTLAIQRRPQAKVSRSGQVSNPRFIAGVGISAGKAQGMAQVAAIVLSYPAPRLLETSLAQGKLDFPYILGLLSYRELLLILAACHKLSVTPDLILVDGQGVAHPRRMGLACHLGLFLDRPTIGCAKSRFCASYQAPGDKSGSYSEVVDKGEIMGVALQPRPSVKPVYVSTGHKIDLVNSTYWVLKCCRGYRLPEPARLAHLVVGGSLKQEKNLVVPEFSHQWNLFN